MQYSIILIKVPFVEDSTKTKVRPAIYLADSSTTHNTIIATFVTSNLLDFEVGDIVIENFEDYNLGFPSLIKVSKIFTIPKEDMKLEIFKIPKSSELEKKIKEGLINIFDL